MSSLIITSNRSASAVAGSISNQNYFQNNCLNDPGSFWADDLTKVYMPSPAWQQAAPWLVNFCAQTSVTWNGVTGSCNPVNDGTFTSPLTHKVDPTPFPSASVTGNCSGLVTENSISTIVIDRGNQWANWFLRDSHVMSLANNYTNYQLDYLYNMNTFAVTNYANMSVLFNDFANGDWGVDNPSFPLYTDFDNFNSCPLRQVGIQAVNPFSISASTYNSLIAGPHVHHVLHQALPSDHVGIKVESGSAASKATTAPQQLALQQTSIATFNVERSTPRRHDKRETTCSWKRASKQYECVERVTS